MGVRTGETGGRIWALHWLLDVLREEKMSVSLRFLSWRVGRREVAKTGEGNCGEGGDDETNLRYIEFEGFQHPTEKVSHSFIRASNI